MDKKICVYAISKNEIKFVDRWYESMKEADYICVLDTGSNDGTIGKLKEKGVIVKKEIIKPWRFDVARNESMKLIPDDADILVCTDLDEVFEEGWAEKVRKGWDTIDNTNRMYYTYAWSHNEIGEAQDVFKYDKIHDRNYKWVYPVHEVLKPIEDDFIEKVVDLGENVYLHHYPDKDKSRSNYFDLLKISVEENPEDSHVAMLYARELLVRDDYEGGLEEYLKVLKMPEVNEPKRALVLLASLLQVAQIYEHLKNYDEALWYCQEFIKEDHTYRDPYFVMAEVYNDMHMFSLAEACVKAGLEYGTHKFNWVERTETWLGWSNDLLSISKYNLGKLDEAIDNVKIALEHNPNNVRLLRNYNIFLQEKININNSLIDKNKKE